MINKGARASPTSTCKQVFIDAGCCCCCCCWCVGLFRNEWQLHKEVKEEQVIKHFAYKWKEYYDVLRQQDIRV